MGQLALDRLGDPGHDDKAGVSLFQPFDDLVVVKPFVGADEHGSDPRRDLGEAGPKEFQYTAGGVNVSGTQLPMPEVLRLSFETKQRVIRWSPMFDRVVTHPRLFLFSVEHKDCGIHVEDKAPGRMGLGDHLCQEPIVKLAQLGQSLRCHAQQESSEGAGIRVSRQPAQEPKNTVGLQQRRSFDSFESKNHGIEQGKQDLANAVTIVALDETGLSGQVFFESDATEEPME